MARSGGMSYPANVRQEAERRKCWMVTVEVNGRFIDNDKKRNRLTLQMAADTKLANRFSKLLLFAIESHNKQMREVRHGS